MNMLDKTMQRELWTIAGHLAFHSTSRRTGGTRKASRIGSGSKTL